MHGSKRMSISRDGERVEWPFGSHSAWGHGQQTKGERDVMGAAGY